MGSFLLLQKLPFWVKQGERVSERSSNMSQRSCWNPAGESSSFSRVRSSAWKTRNDVKPKKTTVRLRAFAGVGMSPVYKEEFDAIAPGKAQEHACCLFDELDAEDPAIGVVVPENVIRSRWEAWNAIFRPTISLSQRVLPEIIEATDGG